MLPCEGDYDVRFSKIISQTFRFTKRIYVEMPDRAGRGALVNHLLTQHGEHRYDTVSCVFLCVQLKYGFICSLSISSCVKTKHEETNNLLSKYQFCNL